MTHVRPAATDLLKTASSMLFAADAVKVLGNSHDVIWGGGARGAGYSGYFC